MTRCHQSLILMPGCVIVVQTDNHVGTTRLWAQHLGMNRPTIRRLLCDLPRRCCRQYLLMRKLLSRLTAGMETNPEEPDNVQAAFCSWTANQTGSKCQMLGTRPLTGSCVRVSGNSRTLLLAAMEDMPGVLAFPAAVEGMQQMPRTDSSKLVKWTVLGDAKPRSNA